MKQAAIMLVMFGTVVAGSLSARADSGNPFGFETNKHPLEYEYCKKEPGLFRGHGYKCSSAPRPHPDLEEEYALQFVEDVGLCKIGARSFSYNLNDADTIVEHFKRQIAKKYGPHHALSPLRPPINEYEERLNKAYPTLVEKKYTWDQKTGFKGLGNVESVELAEDLYSEEDLLSGEKEIKENTIKVKVAVWFTLVTSDACLKEIDDKADHAF